MQVPMTYNLRMAPVAGVQWALVLLVILNLLQLNLLYFSSHGSTRCILKAALATTPRARSGLAASPAASEIMLPGSPLGSSEQLGRPMVSPLLLTPDHSCCRSTFQSLLYRSLMQVHICTACHVTTQTLPDVLHGQADACPQLSSPSLRARSLTAETYHSLGSSQDNYSSQAFFVSAGRPPAEDHK